MKVHKGFHFRLSATHTSQQAYACRDQRVRRQGSVVWKSAERGPLALWTEVPHVMEALVVLHLSEMSRVTTIFSRNRQVRALNRRQGTLVLDDVCLGHLGMLPVIQA